MFSRGAIAQEGRCCAHKLTLAAGDESRESNASEKGCAHSAKRAGRRQSQDRNTDIQNVAACGA
jgi:hypothetical protein